MKFKDYAKKDNLTEKYLDEAMGFVQKLDYQKKVKPGKSLSKKDRELLQKRMGKKGFTTKKSLNPSTPNRQQTKQHDENQLVKIGDIFYNSWGYGQTNIDWYQVVDVSPTGKTVKVRPIAGKIKETGFMSGETVPLKNKFTGPVKQKKIRVSGKEVNLPMEHGWCPKWDGRPKGCSWYH